MIIDNGGNNDGKGGGKPPFSLHVLKALGHAALAWGHVAFAEDPDEEDEEFEAPRRQPRRRKLSSYGRGKAGGGSCCLGKRRK